MPQSQFSLKSRLCFNPSHRSLARWLHEIRCDNEATSENVSCWLHYEPQWLAQQSTKQN
jgi:hypothetical protein